MKYEKTWIENIINKTIHSDLFGVWAVGIGGILLIGHTLFEPLFTLSGRFTGSIYLTKFYYEHIDFSLIEPSESNELKQTRDKYFNSDWDFVMKMDGYSLTFKPYSSRGDDISGLSLKANKNESELILFDFASNGLSYLPPTLPGLFSEKDYIVINGERFSYFSLDRRERLKINNIYDSYLNAASNILFGYKEELKNIIEEQENQKKYEKRLKKERIKQYKELQLKKDLEDFVK